MKKYLRLGLRLRKLRGDIPQKAYAKSIGVSYRAYQDYESGVAIPKATTLDKIAEKGAVTVEWILTGNLRSLMGKVVAEKIEASFMHEGVTKVEENLFSYFYKKGIVDSDDIDTFMNMTIGLKHEKFQEVVDSLMGDKTSPLYIMMRRIKMIFFEGDKTKIEAVMNFLKVLDPLEKKPDPNMSAQPSAEAKKNKH